MSKKSSQKNSQRNFNIEHLEPRLMMDGNLSMANLSRQVNLFNLPRNIL
ncbi:MULTISPECIES: LEPR-XLL domain-containing protein [unclassified Fibrobacter]